ncbi:MAG: dihydroorotate dehydrogenase-like protein [Prolixibacteraceae bacterium]|nr:dihydroorotate dehydrogenase-like protein [Prolixibacteraceae bacterium]MBN2650355.1 dihydroorotate dehydrogenase-like protein [Prolixibacteraceae bacterium]
MANLSTSYMGISLKNPLVLGASSMVTDIQQIQKAEKAGVAAVVFKSLFEEQLQLESLQMDEDLHEYDNRNAEMERIFPEIEHAGPKEHLLAVRKLKESVSIPLIASINAIYEPTWVEYAQMLAENGVDGLELNFYRVPIATDAGAKSIEEHQLKVLKQVKEAVDIPVSVKLSTFYTNPLNFIAKLDKAGADAVVVFNRFFQPDINIEDESFDFPWDLTRDGDYQVTLRYVGLLYSKLKGSLVANRGIKTSDEVLKMILAGADAAQLVSTFYKNGVGYAETILKEIEAWMDKKGYKTLDDFKGKLSKENINDEFVYKRAQYIDILRNSDQILKKYPMR